MSVMDYFKITKKSDTTSTFDAKDWVKDAEKILTSTVNERYVLVSSLTTGFEKIKCDRSDLGESMNWKQKILVFVPSNNAVNEIAFDSLNPKAKSIEISFSKYCWSWKLWKNEATDHPTESWKKHYRNEAILKVRYSEETQLKNHLVDPSTGITRIFPKGVTNIDEVSNSRPLTWKMVQEARKAFENIQILETGRVKQINPITELITLYLSPKAKAALMDSEDFYKHFPQRLNKKTEYKMDERVLEDWGVEIKIFPTEFTITGTSASNTASIAIMSLGANPVTRFQLIEEVENIRNLQFYAYDHRRKELGSDLNDLASSIAVIFGVKGYIGFGVKNPNKIKLLVYSS